MNASWEEGGPVQAFSANIQYTLDMTADPGSPGPPPSPPFADNSLINLNGILDIKVNSVTQVK
jgi:hypothetical protein